MVCVILIVDRAMIPQPEVAGKYLMSFTPDTDEWGLGTMEVTNSLSKAMRFYDAKAAIEFYRQQSVRVPLRDDGKPNRPLTAYTVSIFPVK